VPYDLKGHRQGKTLQPMPGTALKKGFSSRSQASSGTNAAA
jgi:hypothetical protein